jgi:hypothetical protein
MKQTLERLKALVDGEERLVTAVTYGTAGRIEQKTDSFARGFEEMKVAQQSKRSGIPMVTFLNQASVAARSEEKVQAEDKAVRELLYTPAIDKIRDIFSECKASLVQGTANWIQEEPLFKDWMEGRAPILWVFGGPGTGKSFLATRIISDLKLKYPQDPQTPSHTTVAYFYVKEDDQHLHDLSSILKSIALQIANVDPIFKKQVWASHQSGDSFISSRSVWENLLLKFFGADSFLEHIAFIIIDGLDEAPIKTRRALFSFLRTFIETPPDDLRPRLQFAILGRPELRDDIHFVRRERSIDISPRKNHDDIDKYIKENLKNVMILLRMSRTQPKAARNFAKEIRDTILEKADGMFLWAKLVLAQIYEKERESEIRKALSSAPRALDGVIRNVFLRLEKDPDVNHQDLNTIIAWVTCARRPLLLGELKEILRIPTGEPNLVLKDRLRGKLASIFTLSRVQGHIPAVSEKPLTAMDEPQQDFKFLDFDAPDELEANTTSDTGHAKSDVDNATLLNSPEPNCFTSDQFLFDRTHQVVFGHKRIKDYLVEVAFTFNPAQPLDIGIDIRKTEVDITLTLLSVLCKGRHPSKYTRSSYLHFLSYAAENIMKHLDNISILHTPDPDKARIINLLCQLFYNEDCIKGFLEKTYSSDFIKTWFATNQYSYLVRQWFRAADRLDDEQLKQPMCEWMANASLSAKVLLRPMAILASKEWFTSVSDSIGFDLSHFPGYNLNWTLYVWIIYGYHAIVCGFL